MTRLNFERNGWAEGKLDDADEAATFTRLRVRVGNALLTRNYSRRGGGESDAINVPLLPLALHLSTSWWPLLYEPLRVSDDVGFQARHRLDVPMRGYVFPALALCSAGDEAVAVDWAARDYEHSPLQFLITSPPEPVQLQRSDTEAALMDIVEASLTRIRRGSAAHIGLRSAWDQIVGSMNDPAELAYCMTAGRLGLDPYDAESPDLEAFVTGLSVSLFNDISDAIAVDELLETTSWTEDAKARIKDAPSVEVGAFGEPLQDKVSNAAAVTGSTAARTLKARLGLASLRPKKAVNELLGAAVSKKTALATAGPVSMTSLIRRADGTANIGTVAQSARQQRFRACASVYLGWVATAGEDRAGTIAITRRQQASRAFAAELLAPEDYLKERAGRKGFTTEDIEAAASDLICPYDTVLWQSVRARIPLPGVELPVANRASLF